MYQESVYYVLMKAATSASNSDSNGRQMGQKEAPLCSTTRKLVVLHLLVGVHDHLMIPSMCVAVRRRSVPGAQEVSDLRKRISLARAIRSFIRLCPVDRLVRFASYLLRYQLASSTMGYCDGLFNAYLVLGA
jgi:hypothetical protein